MSGRGRRALDAGASIALAAGQTWLAGSTLYLLALLAAGAQRGGAAAGAAAGGRGGGAAVVSGADGSAPAGEQLPGGKPLPSIVALVPAHDEERGVAPVVQALVSQSYPRDRQAVIVIADNCTDATAEVAAAAGATVWVRDEPEARGKGQALGWALARLRSEDPPPDIVLVVDADCIASPNLFIVAARELADPAVDAVQVRYEVSNADESPTAALRAAGFALKHVVRSRGRSRLGLSCGLFGSGMAFRMSVFDRVSWPTSVTEDTELHLRLVEQGVVVRYAEEAAVATPMPATAAAAVDQQTRWETGNAQLASGHVRHLLARGARTGDVQLLGAAAELLVPSQSMLAAGSVGLAGVAAALRRRRPAALSLATLAGQVTYVVAGLWLAGAPLASLRALVHAPGFVAGRLRVLIDVARGRRAQAWVRTERPA